MLNRREIPVRTPENERRCDELGNLLRTFMMIGLSNKAIRETSFGTMVSYAPFHSDEPVRAMIIEANEHYDEFIKRGCGL